jgi:hypothetical protein
MKAGDLVKLKPTTTWARATDFTAGAAIVLQVSPSGIQILTQNQKQIWVLMREIEVLSESR